MRVDGWDSSSLVSLSFPLHIFLSPDQVLSKKLTFFSQPGVVEEL